MRRLMGQGKEKDMEENGHPEESKVILEYEIKCPLCGEIFRRYVERRSPSFPIEEYGTFKIKKSQPHYVSFNSLAHLFFQRRVGLNLTIEDFSEKIGFPENYIESVECGERMPSLKYSLVCAEQFGISLGWTKTRWAKEMTSSFEEKLINRLGLGK